MGKSEPRGGFNFTTRAYRQVYRRKESAFSQRLERCLLWAADVISAEASWPNWVKRRPDGQQR
jgi:hypothetical protein